jgi:hypothetical protein
MEVCMNTHTRNSHGLFDAPVPLEEQEIIVLTQQDMEDQLEAGAFLLDREEAIQAGFLNPYNDDTALVAVK